MKNKFFTALTFLLSIHSMYAVAQFSGIYEFKGDSITRKDRRLCIISDSIFVNTIAQKWVITGKCKIIDNKTIELIQDPSQNEAFYLFGAKFGHAREDSIAIDFSSIDPRTFFFGYGNVAISFGAQNTTVMRTVFDERSTASGFFNFPLLLKKPTDSIAQIHITYYRNIESTPKKTIIQSYVYSFPYNKDYDSYLIGCNPLTILGSASATATLLNTTTLKAGNDIFKKVSDITDAESRQLKKTYYKRTQVMGMLTDKKMIVDNEVYFKVPVAQKTFIPIAVDTTHPYILSQKIEKSEE